MSTGVDAQGMQINCDRSRNKTQIVQTNYWGTRINERYGKTGLQHDFRGTTSRFADPEWDGIETVYEGAAPSPKSKKLNHRQAFLEYFVEGVPVEIHSERITF